METFIATDLQIEEIKILFQEVFKYHQDTIDEIEDDEEWNDLIPMYQDDLSYAKHCHDKFLIHRDMIKLDHDMRAQDTAARDHLWEIFDYIELEIEQAEDDLDCDEFCDYTPSKKESLEGCLQWIIDQAEFAHRSNLKSDAQLAMQELKD